MSIILDGTNGIVTPDIDSGVSTLGPLTQALNLGSTGQVVFPATQNASTDANTLDDYEEGTFTPSWINLTVGNASVNTGIYRKIGDTVHVWWRIQLGSTSSVSGSIRINNLPFVAISTITRSTGTALFEKAGTDTWGGLSRVNGGTTQLLPFFLLADGSGRSNVRGVNGNQPFTPTPNGDFYQGYVAYLTTS